MTTERYQKAKKITIIGAISNSVLSILKLIGGIMFYSHALVADGIHSLSDLLADGLVLFASKFGSQAADETHPYGHQRIETAATFILSLLLVLAGAGIIWDAIEVLFTGHQMIPKKITLLIALLSIIVNEILFHWTHHVGKALASDLLVANAWHHRADAGASVIVCIGIIGSLFGYSSFDVIAAILVGMMVAKLGWNYGWDSIKELVDTAVDPAMLEQIKQFILGIDGVIKIHQLRTRSMGQDVFVDVHIMVEPMISVSEGHFIAQHVHSILMQEFSHIKDVTVHVDPEDDETAPPILYLPNRNWLEKQWLLSWQKQHACIQSWQIHYLDGKIIIDLVVDSHDPDWGMIKQEIIEHTKAHHLTIPVDFRFFTRTE